MLTLVRSWHESDIPKYLADVRSWVNSGKHMLALSFSGFDRGLVSTSGHATADGFVSNGLSGRGALLRHADGQSVSKLLDQAEPQGNSLRVSGSI
jgi:hypothetical protein